MGAKKRKANQWDRPGSELELPPLGQRIVIAMRSAGLSPTELGGGNVAVQLDRMRADPEKGLNLASAVEYARKARVSLVWLATGEGDQFAGPFAEGVELELREFPEQFRRALQATLLISRAERAKILDIARKTFARGSGKNMTSERWFKMLEGDLAEHLDEQSGVRENRR